MKTTLRSLTQKLNQAIARFNQLIKYGCRTAAAKVVILICKLEGAIEMLTARLARDLHNYGETQICDLAFRDKSFRGIAFFKGKIKGRKSCFLVAFPGYENKDTVKELGFEWDAISKFWYFHPTNSQNLIPMAIKTLDALKDGISFMQFAYDSGVFFSENQADKYFQTLKTYQIK